MNLIFFLDNCLQICKVKENTTGSFNCKVNATDHDRSEKFRNVTYQIVPSSGSSQVTILIYLYSNI